MDRQHDILERSPTGQLTWRVAKVGHEQALCAMKELAAHSTNEFVLVHVPRNIEPTENLRVP